MTGKSRRRENPAEKIPLRGLVRCSCGATLTGGFSKGKVKYYLYYRCIRERGVNYRGEIMHNLFYEILGKLAFTENGLLTLQDVFKYFDFPSCHKLIKKVFEAGLIYDGRVFRTSYVHPALAVSCRKLESLGLLVYEQPYQDKLPICTSENFSISVDEHSLAEEQLTAFIIEIIEENFRKRNANELSNNFTDLVKIAHVPDRDLNTLSI